MMLTDAASQKSCGVIPYRRNQENTEYLIVLQTNGCWSFPKGHMEPGETEIQSALRELREETGLSASLQMDLRAVSEYEIAPYVRKQVVLYVGEVSGEIALQETEIVRCLWVGKEELKNYLHPDTYDACKSLLEIAKS